MRIRLIAALALVAVMVPVGTASAGTPVAADMLPDLEMARPHDMRVQIAPNNRKRLRFGSVVYNVGDGPLEVRANNKQSSVFRNVWQRIYRADDTYYDVTKTVRVSYEDDGHNHNHIRKFIVAILRPTGATPDNGNRRLRKLGFCLVDTLDRPGAPVPNAAENSTYWGCGSRYSSSIRTGISVGWGDVYSVNTRYQQIDVTGMPAGTYQLCVTVNPYGAWTEKNGVSSNNSYWFDLNLNPAAGTVAPTNEGAGPCPA